MSSALGAWSSHGARFASWPYLVASTLLVALGTFSLGFVTFAALVLLAAAIVVVNLSARLSFIVVLVSIAILPYWWGINVGGYLPLASLLIVATLPGALARGFSFGNAIDVAVLLGALTIGILAATGASMPGHSFTALSQWIPAYVLGRALVQQVPRDFLMASVSAVFSAVALLAIAEFFSEWNPYIGTAPETAQYARLGTLQGRGGVTRAEWAFGHSIALGLSLALAVPFALASRFRPFLRVIILVMLSVAILVTFSRAALVTAVLAVLLSIVVLGRVISRRTRASVVVFSVLIAIIAIPYVAGVFESATAETTRSAGHRVTLLGLIGELRPFGLARGYYEVGGVFNWHGVISIDNAFIRIAVNFGWVVALMVLSGAICLWVWVLRRSGNVALVSVASAVPALFTVALITQFSIFLWLLVGVAVGMNTHASSPRVQSRVTVRRGGHVAN